MASVRKRKWTYKGVTKTVWALDYKDNDQKRRLQTFKSKKAADARRKVIEQEIDMGIHTAKRQTVTLREAVEAWLRDCDRRQKIGDGMTRGTLKGYVNWANNHVIPELGKIKLTDLTAVRLQEFINEKSTTHAHHSLSHMRVVLKQSLRLAFKQNWLRRNPLVDDPINIPKSAAMRRVEPPSKTEIAQLLNALLVRRRGEYPHARANRIVIVALALFAGMRRGEIIGLQWENVDFDAGLIHVRHSYSRYDGLKEPKTKAGVRSIPMSAPARSALQNYADFIDRDLTGYVIQTKNGTPLSPHHVTGADWKRLMVAAGLSNPDGKPKYTLHAMRHAAVSLLIDQGLPAFHIKRAIGHSKIQTTMDVYGHLFPEDTAAREAFDAVGRQFDTEPLAFAEPVVVAAPKTPQEWDEAKRAALELRAGGMMPMDIARRLSVAQGSVYNWITAAENKPLLLN